MREESCQTICVCSITNLLFSKQVNYKSARSIDILYKLQVIKSMNWQRVHHVNDDQVTEILQRGNKEDIKVCLVREFNFDLYPNASDYLTQSICQMKQQQPFIDNLIKLFKIKEFNQFNANSFMDVFTKIKNMMENSIPKSFFVDVFEKMANFKFQAAQAIVTETFPRQQSSNILKYIAELNNIQKQIERFKLILQKRRKLERPFRTTPRSTELSETMKYISNELEERFYICDNMLESLRQNPLMKNQRSPFGISSNSDKTMDIKKVNRQTGQLINIQKSFSKILTSLMSTSTGNKTFFSLPHPAQKQSFLNFENKCLSFIAMIKKQRTMNQLSKREQIQLKQRLIQVQTNSKRITDDLHIKISELTSLNQQLQIKISELEAQLIQSRTFIKNNQEYSEPLRNYAAILLQNQQLRQKYRLDIGISKGKAEYLQKEVNKRDHLIQQLQQERSKEEENRHLPKQEK